MRHLMTSLTTGLLIMMAAVERAPAVTLVQDGEARAVIVVEREAPKAQQAAEILQRYIEKMSGAKLTIVTDGDAIEPADAAQVHVGHTAEAKRLVPEIPAGYDPTVRPDAFEEEGYVLKAVGDNRVVVAGNNDGPYRGTIYAATRLLRELGCRFYFPNEWGEIVPETKTVATPALDIMTRPDFAVRGIWLSGWIPVTADERKIYNDWCDKIGFNPTKMYPTVGDGFLAYLLPPEEYFESHPEYFAMNEAGERHAGKLRTGRYYENHTMLCLSNPEVLEESLKNLRAAFAGEKEMSKVSELGVGISPPDGTPYCYCPECKKTSQNFRYPTYVHRTMQSEEFFGFATKLAQAFPDKFVSTMAYALREMPPQGVDIPDNVMVMIAPISCDVLHSNASHLWRRAEFVSILRQWREHTPHVTIYDYNPGFLTGFFVPERDVANMAINVPIYKEIDIKGMSREGRKAFMQTWISYYVTAELLWDADADVAALKRDFYDTFFGAEAGKHVEAWWDACEEALQAATIQAHEDFLVNHIYSAAFVSSIKPHVEAARQANMTDAQRQRFEAFALIADHLEAWAQMTAAEEQLDWPAAAAAARRMVDDKLALNKMYSFFIDGINIEKPRPYFTEGRMRTFQEHAARTGGETGALVAKLPLDMRFRRDLYNEGVVGQWYKPDHNDTDWETRNSFYLWDQQEEPIDEAGHDYDGYGWYRATFDVPAEFANKPVRLHLGGIINEGWVWLNGRYVGHKEHQLWWAHAHAMDVDVSEMVEPGKPNTLVVRVWNDAEPGGLYRRGYLYSPKGEAAQ